MYSLTVPPQTVYQQYFSMQSMSYNYYVAASSTSSCCDQWPCRIHLSRSGGAVSVEKVLSVLSKNDVFLLIWLEYQLKIINLERSLGSLIPRGWQQILTFTVDVLDWWKIAKSALKLHLAFRVNILMQCDFFFFATEIKKKKKRISEATMKLALKT